MKKLEALGADLFGDEPVVDYGPADTPAFGEYHRLERVPLPPRWYGAFLQRWTVSKVSVRHEWEGSDCELGRNESVSGDGE